MKTTETYINKKTKAVLRIHNDAGFVELLEYKSNLFPQVIWDLSKAKEILKSWKSDALRIGKADQLESDARFYRSLAQII